MVAVAPFFAVSWNKCRDLWSAGHLPSPHCSSSRGREFRALRIGAHVDAGQLLASIDTPNLDQQFAQAKADLLPPLLLHQLAAVTAERWKCLDEVAIVAGNGLQNRAATAKTARWTRLAPV
jgi:hypothetical protein